MIWQLVYRRHLEKESRPGMNIHDHNHIIYIRV